jgi:hypothetical protein
MTTDKHLVIDNFLPKEYFKVIKDLFTDNDNFHWHLKNFVAKEDANDGFFFQHVFFEGNKINSDAFGHFEMMLNKMQCKALLRLKANLYTKTPEIVKHGEHVDYDFPHRGALLFINTNNGLTILEDGTEIESVENRMVFFNSAAPHRSTTCSDENYRITLNINYF